MKQHLMKGNTRLAWCGTTQPALLDVIHYHNLSEFAKANVCINCERAWEAYQDRKEGHEADLRCMDCGVDTSCHHGICEYYMLRDQIWYGELKMTDGILCIGCLEERLGRRLKSGDFSDAPCNITFPQSDRLIRRVYAIA